MKMLTPVADYLEAVDKYLRSNNIDPMVIGGIQIRKELGARKYNYELVVKFTGVVDLTTLAERSTIKDNN